MKIEKLYLEGREDIIKPLLSYAKKYLGSGIDVIDVYPQLKKEVDSNEYY